MEVVNRLLNYKNLNIVQNTQMFNFSLDSILLPHFVTINKNVKNILDIGCGNAPIPIILSIKTSAKIIGVEIQQDVSKLAEQSIKINNLENQIQIINDDIVNLYKKWDSDIFDVITCNPPFFKVKERSNLNNSNYKALARHEISLNLDQIMQISKKLLKNNGVISIVHRPDRLIEIIQTMKAHNIEPKKVQFVYPKKDKEANILLIEGTKNGKPGLKVLSPIYVHEQNGDYSSEIKEYFQ